MLNLRRNIWSTETPAFKLKKVGLICLVDLARSNGTGSAKRVVGREGEETQNHLGIEGETSWPGPDQEKKERFGKKKLGGGDF